MKIEWILIVLIFCFSTRVYSLDFTVKFHTPEQFDQFQRIVAEHLEFNYNHYFTSFEYFEGIRKSILTEGLQFTQREASRILRSIILSKNVRSRELIKLFLDQGVPPYVKDARGWAPIHYAASVGRLGIIKEIQLHGSSLNAKNNEGNTPLHLGVQEGHLEVVRYLLTKNAGKYLSNKLGDTILHTAIRYNVDEEMMELLLSNNMPLEFQNRAQDTALHLAVYKGLFKHVKMLLDAGMFIDGRDGSGNTALHISVFENDKDMTELLIQYGADINVRNDLSNTALHISVLQNHKDMVDFLIQYGAEIDIANNRHETPLYYAIVNHNKVLVRFFLEKGADVNGVSHKKAFIQASLNEGVGKILDLSKDSNKVLEMLDLLLEYHADINKKNVRGETFLHLIVSLQNSVDLMRASIERGADIHAVNIDNETPLLVASLSPQGVHVLDILLDYGADIDTQDIDGNTALHNAVLTLDIELVEQLLARGAHAKITNNKGHTAFDLLSITRTLYRKESEFEILQKEEIAQVFEKYYKKRALVCANIFTNIN